jgi:hypothetical protein
VTNNYQKNAPRTTSELRLALPQTASVAMAEIAEDMQEGLLALAVGAGLQDPLAGDGCGEHGCEVRDAGRERAVRSQVGVGQPVDARVLHPDARVAAPPDRLRKPGAAAVDLGEADRQDVVAVVGRGGLDVEEDEPDLFGEGGEGDFGAAVAAHATPRRRSREASRSLSRSEE